MATVTAPAVGQKLMLPNVDWRTYKRILQILAPYRHLRLTYDRGTLEIMSLLHEHECDARFLGRLVVVLTEELGLPIKGGGSTTFRRRRRGLEPDDCYWIASEPQVRGKRQIDLRVDPPPDLAIEADVTSSSLDQFAIYAVLQVPEIWRPEGNGLTFHLLGSGQDTLALRSRACSFLTPADLFSFMVLRFAGPTDENEVIRQFRLWVRQQVSGTP